MAEFTASPDVSGFAPPNQLFNYANAVGAAQGLQSNQLGIQGKQIDLANANMAQVGQAAAGLLSAYPDEASRAAAYPKVVGMLQSQGVAMNAPQTYPGEGALRAIVNASIPAKDLYSSGALLTPAQQAALGQTGQTGTTAVTPAPATGAAAGGFGAQLAQSESGGKTSVINPQGYTGTYQFGKQRLADLGYYTPAPGEDMKDNTTWAGKVSVPGFNVTDQQSFAANPAAQQAVFNTHLGNIDQAIAATPGASRFDPNGLRAVAHLGGIEGMQKFVASGGVFSPSDANGTSLTAYYNKFSGGAPGGATTAAAAPAGGGGTPGSYQVASTVPTAPPGSTAAPGAPPAAPQFTYPNGKVGGAPDAQGGVHYADGNYGTPPPGPRVPVAAAAPAPAQPSAAQPGQPQGPATAPGGTAQLPDASTIPTGRNSPAWQQAQQLIDKGLQLQRVAGSNAGMRAQAQALIAEGTREQGLDSEVPAQLNGRPGNLNTNTGAFTYASPLPSPRFTGGAAVPNKTTGGWDQPTPATQADAVAGHWGVSGSGAPQFFPDATVPAEGGYDNMETAYKRDSENITGIATEGRLAQGDQVRVQEMRNLLKTADTGSGTETQAAIRGFLQRWAPQALTDWTTNYANLKGPAAIQMFQKLGFMGATSQEQQTTSRGGYLMTQQFQKFNPGAQLLTATNQGLLAQRLIGNQAGIDYSQGAQDQFAEQEKNFTSSKPSYSSLAQYDRQWQAQRNPQVYAAATGALGGQDYATWSKNLSQPEIERALDVVHRADPSAVVNGQNGRLDLSNKGQPQGQTSAAPAVGAIQQGYRFKGGDPSSQANWDRVQ